MTEELMALACLFREHASAPVAETHQIYLRKGIVGELELGSRFGA